MYMHIYNVKQCIYRSVPSVLLEDWTDNENQYRNLQAIDSDGFPEKLIILKEKVRFLMNSDQLWPAGC